MSWVLKDFDEQISMWRRRSTDCLRIQLVVYFDMRFIILPYLLRDNSFVYAWNDTNLTHYR